MDKCLNDLKDFDTVIMGRNTYEFGYRFGLQPGRPAYPHMDHYIFFDSLVIENSHKKIHMVKPDLDFTDKLRQRPGSDIYLFGRGIFAGWLPDQNKIDVLILKLSPFITGSGIKLFGNSHTKVNLKLIESEKFDHGLQILTYYLI